MSRFIRKLHLKNLLSFEDCEVELQDLNVLIGANGSGKSNLIEAIGLLRSLVYDHGAYLRQGGGPAAWIWKGQRRGGPPKSAEFNSTLASGESEGLVHSFHMDSAGTLNQESLHTPDRTEIFSRVGKDLWLNGLSQYESDQSVFRQYRNPADPTPVTAIGKKLESIRIYREFRTGKNEPLRGGTSGGTEGSRLDESGQNLALVLHDFDAKNRLDQMGKILGELNADYKRVKPRYVNGVWLVQLDEEGLLDPVLSQRISDGTLKFLCLAAVLLDPEPPPLICIEEPETGLHPEALRVVGNLLLQAAARTQLVVTTHSADLINEFTSIPDAVLVTRKSADHATEFRRLERAKLKPWLKRYRLGELWQKGEIGGNRW
jgi:predicted ATPase